MMHTFEETRAGYLAMWTRAKLRDDHRAAALATARKIADDTHRPAFQEVENATRVPWYLVGCLLYRESDLDLGTYLGNGQSLHHVTTEVPAGRGPWPTFAAGAIDALTHEGMAGISDWSIERMLYWAERFNGQGYFGHGNSPYVWAGTDQYTGGLFTSDHHYNPNEFDHRLGVAALLKALAEIYPDIAQALTHKETIPMPTSTTTAAPVAHAPTPDPIPQIIAFLETAKGWLPFLANFMPPPTGTILRNSIPIIEELLQMVEDAKAKSGIDLFQAIGARIQTIGAHVQSTAQAAKN